jgi:hypothetical protein
MDKRIAEKYDRAFFGNNAFGALPFLMEKREKMIRHPAGKEGACILTFFYNFYKMYRAFLFFLLVLVSLTGFICVSCDQSPIFYAISQEEKPKKPLIPGNPTNIVEFGGNLYVASRFSRNIYKYENGGWSKILSPGDRIVELAATTTDLYALTGEPTSSTTVWKRDSSGDWKNINSTGVVQTIYGAGSYVFASTKEGIYYYGGSGDFQSLNLSLSDGQFLNGVALDNSTYCLAISGKGIYTFANSSLSSDPVTGTSGKLVVGIIKVGSKIVAVTRGGEILYSDSNSFASASTGATFSGSMGLWKENSTSLLLVGIRGGSSSTVHGYREIALDSSGEFDTGKMGLGTPGKTVSSTDKYTSTMGLHVITSIRQAADGVLFASTNKNGLWKLYNDGVWNAQD